jgi:hypothetical protein
LAGRVNVPPFAPASAHSDLDGNLWVRTSIVMLGGSINLADAG